MDTSASAPESTPLPAPEPPETLLKLLLEQPSLSDPVARSLKNSPATFLDLASRLVAIMPLATADLSGDVDLKTPRPIRALAAATSYFRRGRTIDMVGIDLPRWLADLDESHISRVRYRERRSGEEWLVEAALPGGPRLAAHLVTESGMGALNDAFVTDGSIRAFERSMANSGVPGGPFDDVDLSRAAISLVDALGRYRATIGDPAPSSDWPGNEALVTWMIATLLHQTESRGVAA